MPDFEQFWTFQTDEGEVYDGEFLSKDEALETANLAFCEQCMEDGVRADKRDIALIRFTVDDNGDRTTNHIEHCKLTYIYEPDQYEEHGTWNKSGTGCL